MNTQSNIPIDLKEAVKRLDSLPAMPVIAQKLLALKLDTDQDEQQMLLLIAQDPLISAKIIGLANSPLVGASRKISTVKDASMLLGLKRVQSVATGLAEYPKDVLHHLTERDIIVVPVDAFDIAREVGEIKTANVVMVGALSTFLPIDPSIYEEVIRTRVPERFRDVNLRAFAAGRKVSQ